jgi:hypothetical protein
MDKQSAAKQIVARALKVQPDCTISLIRENVKNWQYANMKTYLEGLSKAGVPE